MDELLKEYDKYSMGRPLTIFIQRLLRGIPRWRITILEVDGAPAGDKELVFAEDPDREECIRKAMESMKERL